MHDDRAIEASIRDMPPAPHGTQEVFCPLFESQEMFFRLFEFAPDAILVVDQVGAISRANVKTEELFGYQREELIGKPVEVLIPDRFAEKHVASRSAYLNEQRARPMGAGLELFGKRRDGSEFPVDIMLSPVQVALPSGEARRLVLAVVRDITERKLAEAQILKAQSDLERQVRERTLALQESESRFRQLADTIPQLAWMAQPDGHVYWYNKQWYDYTGTTLEAMEGWGWQSVHDPAVLPKVVERWRDSIATGQPFDMVFPLRGKDGRFRSFLTRVAPLRSPEGQILQWFGTNTEISERVQMEEELRRTQVDLEERVRERSAVAEAKARDLARSEAALREQSQLMESILNSIGEAVVVADTEGRFLLFNPAAKAIMGFGPNGIPRSWKEVFGFFFYPDARTPVPPDQLPLAKAVRGEPTDSGDYFVRHAGNPGRHITVTARPILTDQGTVRGGVAVFRDMTARKQAEAEIEQAKEAAEARAQALARSEAALRQQTQLMEAVLNSIGEGVVVADMDGRFLLFNPAAEAILGVGLTEASPEKWNDVYGAFYPDAKTPFPANQNPLLRAIQGEATNDCDLFIRNPQNSGCHITVTSRPILSEQGTVRGGVAVFRDITARKQAEASLKQAKEIAESANRAKSEFLAHMSHEIRTPMNGILGMTELALDTSLSAEQREYLNSVKLSADALLAVINDILDFSKIEAGMLDLDPVPFRLRDSLSDILKPLALRAHKKGLELAYHVLPGVPDALHGDKGRLRQIIVNLVGNAIKFTERGEVVVHVEAQDQTDKEVNLHVWVADTGIGIPDDMQSTIFAPFEQADNSIARRYGGTGLGLTISARLAEKMVGRTWLKSKVGQGSTFHFTARLGLQDKAESFLLTPEAVSLKDVPVLIVDDNASAQNILVEMLTQWGMRPTAVADKKAALEELKRAAESGVPFPLVLLDAVLPDSLGPSLVEQLERRTQASVAVILMVSSAERPTEAKASYRLSKPIKQSDLLDIVQMALADMLGDGTRADLDHPAVPVKEGNDQRTHRPLRILLAEDNLVNQMVAVGMLEKAGHSVFRANNGREAVSALESQIFDVVLMDVQMPEMDGLEATAAIRAREKLTGRRTPIIALTAHAMKGDRERILAAGMDGYVSKPIRPMELWQAMGECVPLLRVAEDEKPAEEQPDQTLDRTSLLARIGGNTKRLTQILRLFSTESPRQMGELQEAVLHRNVERIRWVSHSLKGTLGNLSASAAYDAAFRLEELSRGGDFTLVDDAFAVLQLKMHRLQAAVAQFDTDLNS